MTDVENRVTTVSEYHERTKHHLHSFGRPLRYTDWDNPPHPFRIYEGAARIPLPLAAEDDAQPYSVLYTGRQDGGGAVDTRSIGRFFELSLGLSAWKQSGQWKWSLRMNPSSGNLHPTEAYVILPETNISPACLAHYSPLFHSLEVRARLGEREVKRIADNGGFGIILSSIYWREAWKYGERAFRYCHHDAGHALAALRFSANLLGWKLTVQPGVGTSDLDRILGFDEIEWPESEGEHAICLAWIHLNSPSPDTIHSLVAGFGPLSYEGRPNRLSENHVQWDIVDSVSEASRSPGECSYSAASERPSPRHFIDSSLSASSIIRRRRSALAYDFGRSRTERDTFLSMLERTLPRGYAPFDGFPFEPQVHLVLFVYEVDGLEPGLYILIRNDSQEDELRERLSRRFEWEQPLAAFPLYRLERGDFRKTAATVSCLQEIAGVSAFSLGMLARFRPNIEKWPWSYPRLLWETGIIGQVLYLEAEAHELRGTGIGCFFDDEMHRLLGLEEDTYQSLYHFTVGVAVEDSRVQTLEPYHHLRDERSTRRPREDNR
jgi:SagB-type dehydrogenase family enzyme